MELSSLIPNNSESWNIKNGTLFYKKLHNIPMAQIEDDIVYIFLECSLPRITLQLIKHVMSLDVEFYMLPPSFSHPACIIDNSYAIRHYFTAYSNQEFFDGFNKIGFDFTSNLVGWCKKEDCVYLIKENYEKINTDIQKTYYDWFAKKDVSDYSVEIREEFRTLYRDIQISMIL